MNGNFGRILWYVFATTRGGPTRVRIMDLLDKRPYNMHQISKELRLDYKTVQHHIRVLEENRVVTAEEKKYGTIYFPSGLFENVKDIFNEIKNKVGEK
ncbi:MAG: winged helix-turn-helix transcriptional regulator [Candidatus Aenigmarchaeota archaeon]|nr:winged helix-turn-helix transcriptional regulator [Candidatus Aenigmarchaeota archaeon]